MGYENCNSSKIQVVSFQFVCFFFFFMLNCERFFLLVSVKFKLIKSYDFCNCLHSKCVAKEYIKSQFTSEVLFLYIHN